MNSAAAVSDLRAYARTLPSQGGVEIGPILEQLAADVPPTAAIVEVGCWLGAGTAHLALGAKSSGVAIHVYDRWRATVAEIKKAKSYGIELRSLMDTLPMVRASLEPFDANIHYHQGDIRQAAWGTQPIGLYVDDATKVESLWLPAMRLFSPHFIPQKTHLVLMDYHFDEKFGTAPQYPLEQRENYAAQKRYMQQFADSFELVADRPGGTSTAVFRFLG